ncbi:LysR family transcriptional regulator [Vibrio vulnificus]|uniref:LysR family transcriptional regulator n=1 Tax=Vibrio vulnificus TaxID=672 RepID=UPI001592B4B2|nr:LysR family transcriptional regulator [Vibrio vulnificus]EJE8554921.1 LysR family transcriptional regulator [Vibrio vulnificus]NVD21490.1 LysR family transcriptional regulator [Vibrio vulnificus]
MLNPVWLTTFKTLIEVGHFTKTAEKLFMTQPGVSQHIRKLEESCGAALIERDKKSFEITEAGQRVYQYAKQLESEQAELLQSLQFDNPYAGVCRVACSGALGLKLYPQLLDLQCKYPELIPQLEVAPNHKIIQAVLNGDVDLGIVTHLPQPALFEVEKMGTDELCLFYPAQYQGKTLDDIIALGLIEHPDSHHYLELYLTLCGETDQSQMDTRHIPARGYVNQLSQILLPVAQGLGFTVLPHSAMSQFPLTEHLAIYPSAQRVEESLYLISKKARTLPARFEVITHAMRQAL